MGYYGFKNEAILLVNKAKKYVRPALRRLTPNLQAFPYNIHLCLILV